MKWILIPLAVLCIMSCVSLKEYNSTRAEAIRLGNDANARRERCEELIERNNLLTEKVEVLAADTARLMRENVILRSTGGKVSGNISTELSNLLLQIQENELEIKELKKRLGEQ